MGLQTQPTGALSRRIAAVEQTRKSPALGVTHVLAGIWAVASSIPFHKPYVVKAEYDEAGNVVWTCSCPHFTFTPGRTDDKHIDAVQADPSAASYIKRCVTCGSDPALSGKDQCVGCQAVYPFGQEAALEQERIDATRCAHGECTPTHHCIRCARIAHDPVEALSQSIDCSACGSGAGCDQSGESALRPLPITPPYRRLSRLAGGMSMSMPTPDDFQNGAQDPRYNYPDGTTPCVVCAKPMKDATALNWLWLHDGGARIVTTAEGEALNAAGGDGADCGSWPIGSDCLRAHPDVRPYVLRR